MFWFVMILFGAMYLAGLLFTFVLFDGAAYANELWDQSNEELWQARYELDWPTDAWREENAA